MTTNERSSVSFSDLPGVGTDENNVLRKINASELICDVLVNFGVTHVFGGHGGAIVGLVDAIVAHPKLTWVYMRCEVNASQAAMAYAKLHGSLGCCIATSGPGAGHLLSGLVDADQDRVPLLCITGLKSAGAIRHSDFQDIDQGAIFRMAGIGMSESVNNVDQLIPLLRNALYLTTTTSRCSHLAIPIDVQLSSVTAPKWFNFRPENLSKNVLSHASTEEIHALAAALIKERMERRHMVIFCGWRAHPLGGVIEALARFLEVPVITSFDGKGTVQENTPNSFGVAGMYGFVGGGRSQSVLENCEVVVAICLADLSKAVADKSDMQVRRLIQIESDLSTGDALRYLSVHSFESGHLASCLPMVLHDMESKKEAMKLSFSGGLTRMSGGRETRKTQLSIVPTASNPAKEGTCHPGIFFKNMSFELENDAIICADIGDNALWMASTLSANKGQRTLTSEHMGIMGFALNAGLAASCSTGGKRQVLVVAGDGGFQMSSNELATLKDHGCRNVLVVIVVNSRLGRVKNEKWGPGVHADGCDIGSPDYAKLFDAHGYPNGCNHGGLEIGIHARGGRSCCPPGSSHLSNDAYVSLASGQHMWETYLKEMNKERNRSYTQDAFENFNSNKFLPLTFSGQTKEKLESLKGWIDSLQTSQKSSCTWIGSEFLSISPAEVFQHQLSEMMGEDGIAPDVFSTQEEKGSFDKEFWKNLMKSFTSEDLSEMFDRGTSNGHPLRLQILAFPKGTYWKLHAHPNLELNMGMKGTLYEYALTEFAYPKEKLERLLPHANIFPTEEGIKYLMDKFECCTVIEDQGSRSQFSERVYATQGTCRANPIGSVHQSFSGEEEGALLFLLWSGCHANIKSHNVKHKRGAELLHGV